MTFKTFNTILAHMVLTPWICIAMKPLIYLVKNDVTFNDVMVHWMITWQWWWSMEAEAGMEAEMEVWMVADTYFSDFSCENDVISNDVMVLEISGDSGGGPWRQRREWWWDVQGRPIVPGDVTGTKWCHGDKLTFLALLPSAFSDAWFS